MEINDLIDDTVNKFYHLYQHDRSLGTDSDSEDALSALSYEETVRIAGGLTTGITVEELKPVCQLITVGLVAPEPLDQ